MPPLDTFERSSFEGSFVSNTEKMRRVIKPFLPHMYKKILNHKPPIEIFNVKLISKGKYYFVSIDERALLNIRDDSAEDICSNFRTIIEKNIREHVDSKAVVKGQLYRYSLFDWNNYRCKLYYSRKP